MPGCEWKYEPVKNYLIQAIMNLEQNSKIMNLEDNNLEQNNEPRTK